MSTVAFLTSSAMAPPGTSRRSTSEEMNPRRVPSAADTVAIAPWVLGSSLAMSGVSLTTSTTHTAPTAAAVRPATTSRPISRAKMRSTGRPVLRALRLRRRVAILGVRAGHRLHQGRNTGTTSPLLLAGCCVQLADHERMAGAGVVSGGHPDVARGGARDDRRPRLPVGRDLDLGAGLGRGDRARLVAQLGAGDG